MIIVKDDSGKEKAFYVLDAHHHIGRDVDGHTNNPVSPGGSFDFIKRTGTMLMSKIRDDNISLRLHPAIETMIEKHPEWKKYFAATGSIDQFVAFPFQDVFRKKPGDKRGEYWRSNENIARWSTRVPYSLKIIGYARINPMEGDLAIEELRAAVKLGLRGLKLHPRSDGWSDHITSDKVAKILVEAAKYGLNVVFDTRGFWQVEAIYEVTLKAKAMLENTNIPVENLKVQPAHIGFHTGHDELYEILAHPNIHGDLSGVHGAGISKLFGEASEYIPQYTRRKRWSEAILFGTDFNYFDAPHASEVIAHILSDEFVGDDIDRQNILGYNALKFIPSYGAPIFSEKEMASVIVNNIGALEEVFERIAEIDATVMSIDPMLVRTPSGDRMSGFLIAIKKEERIRIVGVTSFVDNVLVFRASEEFIRTYISSFKTLRYDEDPMHRKCVSSIWPREFVPVSRLEEVLAL